MNRMKMKRIVSLLSALVLVFGSIGVLPAMAAEVIAAPPTVFAHKLADESIVLDGSLDEEIWQKLDLPISIKTEAFPTNNQAYYGITWDEEALYVAVSVKDAYIVVEDGVESVSQNDAIELMIDPDFDKAFDDSTLYLAIEAVTGKVEQKNAQYSALSSCTDLAKIGEMEGGYTAEFRIPFSVLGIEAPQAGIAMHYAVSMKDKDTAGSAVETINSVINLDTADPSTWDILYLENSAGLLVANPGTADVDGKLEDGYRWGYSRIFAENGFSVKMGALGDLDDLYVAFDIDLLDEGLSFSTIKPGKIWLFLSGENNQSTGSKSNTGRDIELAFTPPKRRFNAMRTYDPSLKSGYSNSIIGSGNLNIDYFMEGTKLQIEVKIPWIAFGADRAFLSDAGWEVSFEDFLGYSGTLVGCEDPWKQNSGYGDLISNDHRGEALDNHAPVGPTPLYSYTITQGQTLSGQLKVTDADNDALSYTLVEPFTKNSNGLFELDSMTGAWKYTTPDPDFTAKSFSYFVMASDGKGGQFRTRIEIRVEPSPTFITWHVDKDHGRNTNDGRTKETAFKTIAKAHEMTKPGDTVLIYESKTPYSGFTITNSGAPGAYITYKAAPGNHPKIARELKQSWETIAIEASYIIVEHLDTVGNADDLDYHIAWTIFLGYLPNPTKEEKRAAMRYDSSLSSTNGITILPASNSDGSEANPDERITPHHVIVRDCTIDRMPSSGFYAVRSDYITIENNTITNNGYWDMFGSSGISVLGCMDTDDRFDEHKIIVRNNYQAGNRHFIPYIPSASLRLTDGNGIIIDSTNNWDYIPMWRNAGYEWPIFPYQSRILVANNLCYENGGAGILCFESDHVDVINNTTYNNGACEYLDYSDFFATPSIDTNIFNNIVYSRTNTKMMITGENDTKVAYDNNLFYNYNPNRTNLGDTMFGNVDVGEHNIYGEDPLFKLRPEVDNSANPDQYPDNWTAWEKDNAYKSRYNTERNYDITQYPADFTLQEGSPALNAGNAEWSEKVGNTDNRLGIFGVIGAREQKSGTPAAIQTALDAACAVQSGITIGSDENALLAGVKFVSEHAMTALNDAKSKADELDITASQEEIDAALAVLNTAVEAFKADIREGILPCPELRPNAVSKDKQVIANPGTAIVDGVLNEGYSMDFRKHVDIPGYTAEVGALCDTEFLYVAIRLTTDNGYMRDQSRDEMWFFLAGDNDQSPTRKSLTQHDLDMWLGMNDGKIRGIRIYDPNYALDDGSEPFKTNDIPARDKASSAMSIQGKTCIMEMRIPWASFKPDRKYNDMIGWEAYLGGFMGNYYHTIAGNARPWWTNEGYAVFILNNENLK